MIYICTTFLLTTFKSSGKVQGRSRVNSLDRYVDDDEIPTDLTEEADAHVFGRQSSTFEKRVRTSSFGKQQKIFERRYSMHRQSSLESHGSISRLTSIARPSMSYGPHLGKIRVCTDLKST